ncbi:WASH complex subunit 3 [Plecturocebus cupreus]
MVVSLKQFVVHMVQFLVGFSTACEEKLGDLSLCSQQIETTLNILDTKSSSTLDLDDVTIECHKWTLAHSEATSEQLQKSTHDSGPQESEGSAGNSLTVARDLKMVQMLQDVVPLLTQNHQHSPRGIIGKGFRESTNSVDQGMGLRRQFRDERSCVRRERSVEEFELVLTCLLTAHGVWPPPVPVTLQGSSGKRGTPPGFSEELNSEDLTGALLTNSLQADVWRVSLCCPGWSSVVQSWLIAALTSQTQAILPPLLSKYRRAPPHPGNFLLFVEIESCFVVQASLKLTASNYSPTSASRRAQITGMKHCTCPMVNF